MSLSGTSWEFFEIAGIPVEDGGAPPSIAFSDEGRVSGSTGVNRLSGTFSLDGDHLTLGPIAMTRMMGPPNLAEQEQRLTAVLAKVAIMRIAGPNLELDHGDSVSRLRMVGDPPMAGAAAEPTDGWEAVSPDWGPDKVFALVAAAIGWYALILQLVLLVDRLDAEGEAWFTAVIRFFSFFTILSNLIAALSLTVAALGAATPIGRWFNRAIPQAGVFMYIAVTGLVYTFVLASIWEPDGWDLVADSLLHYVMPALFVVYWVLFRPHGTLDFAHIPRWLIFPVAYGIYTMIRGPFVDWYPYFFLDVEVRGYAAVLAAILGLALAFAVAGFAVIGLDSFLARRRS
ncbi:MAG TPA: Pr6Pr family membrane protein [Acidimicrobiia bacterium]|jgi:heat shock protein HslJ